MFSLKSLIAAAGMVISVLAMPASAAVVTFESQAAFRCDFTNQSDGGLDFAHNFAACFYSPSSPADFPTAPLSTVMGIGFSDITVTKTGGGVFSLQSVDLAFGPFNHNSLTSDTTLVTGFLQGGGTVSSLLTIDYSFDTYVLDWSNLTSVVFGELQNSSEYLAFDNVAFDIDNNQVPEPTSLALLGLGLVGLASMRRKQKTS